MYFRLVVGSKSSLSHHRLGVFSAAGHLLDQELASYEADGLEEALDWFNENLPMPWCRDERVIFWFRSSARECGRRVWRLANALRCQGLWVDILTTRAPGYVEYEDEWQVAAVPYRDCARSW